MSLLLDTHVFYWWNLAPERLSVDCQQRIADPERRVFVSAATIYEISFKRALGKLDWPGDVSQVVERNGFELLPIEGRHADEAATLPLHHRDPFDRLLIAQAQLESLHLATRDTAMSAYDVRLYKV